MKKGKVSAGMLARVALLVALNVVLTRVLTVLNSQYLKVGLGFLPVALCGMLYGPVWGMVCGALGDLVGALLFPAGDFFIGFTVTAGLTGLFFGLFLHGENVGWRQLAYVTLTNCVGLTLGVTTLMLAWWFQISLPVLLPSRAVQAAVTAAAYFIFIPLMNRKLVPRLRKARLV